MAKTKPYHQQLKQLMAKKSRLLSKAEAVEGMGLVETAQPLWASAAACEERIAPLLDLLDRESEAALHRISAASCFEKCAEPSRAANLYRAVSAHIVICTSLCHLIRFKQELPSSPSRCAPN